MNCCRVALVGVRVCERVRDRDDTEKEREIFRERECEREWVTECCRVRDRLRE